MPGCRFEIPSMTNCCLGHAAAQEIRLQDLHVEGFLGAGGFASVELVTHQKTGKQYALKMVSKAPGDGGQVWGRGCNDSMETTEKKVASIDMSRAGRGGWFQTGGASRSGLVRPPFFFLRLS